MEYTPELTDNVFIAKIENDPHYFVHQPDNDVRLKVNAQTHYFLKLIDGEKTVTELTMLMNSHFNQNISRQEIERLIQNTLEPNGIIKTNREVIKKDRAAYLTLRMTLIPHAIVSKIAGCFQFLFFERIWYFIGVLLTGLAIVYASAISFQGLSHFITPANILSYIPFALFSCVIHELGHASACEKFGMKAGSIGFGFYLFIPVFYADVSNAWSLSPQKRVIINIAGMYFQLLISCMLVMTYFITGNEWVLYASLFNIISFLPNFNPFVRYDGYWILSDLLGINNLISKAEKIFKATLAWFLNKRKGEAPVKTATDRFLVSYFVLNRMMVVALLFAFVILNGDSVFYYFPRFFKFISSIIMNPEILSFELIKTFIMENLVSIMFYVLLFSFVRRMLARRSQQG